MFFISLALHPIIPCLSLAFSIFTLYPLTRFFISPHKFLLPLAIFALVSFDCFILQKKFPLRILHSLLSITSTVKTSHSSSKLELGCLYSERSQVQSAKWKYQDESHQLHMSSNSPGSITTVLTKPITSDTAGNYTCTLQLKNGKTIWATQAVTLPTEGGRVSQIVSQCLVCSYFLCHLYFKTSES